MSTDEQQTARYRKPDLSRAQPIRRLTGLRGAEPAAGSTVAEGVRAGYQVIEDYLRQGRESAAAAAPPTAASPERLTERFFQYASDLTSVWLELMHSSVLGPSQPTAAEQGAGLGAFELPRAQPAAAAVSSTPRRSALACAIRLRSARPVDARCELFEDAPHELNLSELRAQDPALPILRGVSLSRDAHSGRLQLALDIDPAQPAAAYSGLIVDRATHAPAGLVYVRLMEESA